MGILTQCQENVMQHIGIRQFLKLVTLLKNLKHQQTMFQIRILVVMKFMTMFLVNQLPLATYLIIGCGVER
jgi:hypothetical protein